MKHQIQYTMLAFALLILNAGSAWSQQDSTKQQVELKLSMNYNSGLNYYGRVDSLNSSGVFPMVEIWFSPQFYISAAPIFVNNKSVSFDYAGTVATVGYQFNADNKWLGNFYLLKPFYEKNSQLVQSALKAQGGITVTFLNKILNITGGGDIKLSDKTDFGATGGLDHIIRLELKDDFILIIDPSAYVYAGTQQFSRSYIRKTSYLLLPPVEQEVTESYNKFRVLAYELSVPVLLAKGKFQLSITPAYVIPQNLVTIEDNPAAAEKGKPMFYLTAGVKVSF